jgi:hypothetical protein
VETATWFIPKQKLSDKAVEFFDDLRGMFKDVADMNIKFDYFREGQSIQQLVSGIPNAVMFVSLYESIYLENFDKFIPLFKIKSSPHDGLLVVRKDSTIQHITDLVGQKVMIPKGTDRSCIDPIILYLVKNCEVKSAPKSFLTFYKAENRIEQLLNNRISAILTDTFEYNMLIESERKKLKVIGRYPLESEFVAIASPDFNVDKFRRNSETWLKKKSHNIFKDGYMLAPIYQNENDLVIETIDGLGYNLRDFIEQYSDLVIKTISNSQAEEFKILNEKYNGLQVFSEKLVNMYKEVRDSRDRLNDEIDASLENQVLFLKDGTILGVSRGFLNWLNTSRQDIIGRNIADYINPNMNKSFRELIQQIDYGLIKSFGVRLLKDSNNENPVKMDFTMLELQDSKIILGIIGKKRLRNTN